MKKIKALLLLFLLSITSSLTINTKTVEAKASDDIVRRDEDIVLEYTDERSESSLEGTILTRHYTNITVGDITEIFKAPSGCVLTIEPNDFNIATIANHFKETTEAATNENYYSMIYMQTYRYINGVKFEADYVAHWSVDIGLQMYLWNNLSSLTLYESDEKTVDLSVSASLEVGLYYKYTDGDQQKDAFTKLIFDFAPYEIKKYEKGDILNLKTNYYLSLGNPRIDVTCQLLYDIFNEKYGFKTDGRSLNEDGSVYYENYIIKYIDIDTNSIVATYTGKDIDKVLSIESSPNKPINLSATLSFTQDDISYIYYSNTVTVQNCLGSLTIDGFNNRTSIGVGNTHQFRLETLFDPKDIDTAWFYLEDSTTNKEVVNHVLEPTYPPVEENSPTYQLYHEYQDDFFTFEYKCDTVGEVTLIGNIKIDGATTQYYDDLEFTFTVTENEIEYTPLNEGLTVNVDDVIDVVAGGSDFVITPNLASDLINDGEVINYTYSLSRLNVIDVKQVGDEFNISTIGSGVVVLTISVNTKGNGIINKSITINSVDNIYSIASVTVNDEFHYSGQNLEAKLHVEHYNNLLNFAPEWKVFNRDGEEVEFVDNHDLSITVIEPKESDYTISAYYHGVEINSLVVQVRDVNVNEFVKNNIIWIVLITLLILGLFIFGKILIGKKGSIVKKIDGVIDRFDKIDAHDKDVVKKLNHLRLILLADIDYAKNIDMNALNEYEKAIRSLAEAMVNIKKIAKNKDKLSETEYLDTFNDIRNKLEKALIVAREIEDAKQLALRNSYMANENNIVSVEPVKKVKPKKEKKTK